MAGMDADTELEDVFALVADQTRLDILRVLWERRVDEERTGEGGVSFSTLREEVGVRDSGRFNYHLDKLVPSFVRSDEDGYSLTYAGQRIIGAAVSGVYTDSGTELEALSAGVCTSEGCEGTIQARYRGGEATIACNSCDRETVITAPPILAGAHDPAESPDVLGRYALTVIQKTIRGFCHLCSGPVRASVSDDRPDEGRGEQITVLHRCQECGSTSYTSAAVLLIDDPAVISLFYDAEIDYRQILFWRKTRSYDWEETIVDEDPLEIEVTFAVGEEELTITMDERLDPVAYDRA